MNKKPLVGISTCLLGEKVRYDGGHKLNHYLRDTFGKYVEYLSVCPEVEFGMSVPREAINLFENKGKIRLITEQTNIDITDKMNSWIKKRLKDLSNKKLCGFIFKSKSPSCGLSNAEIHRKKGIEKNGVGLFAKAFTEFFSLIPVIDEKNINNLKYRENFIEQIFLIHRWSILKEEPKSLKILTDFYTSHKYLIMAHSPKRLKELGGLLANQKEYSLNELYEKYFELLIKCIKKPAPIKKNTNVLIHLMGYCKNDLTRDEKEELLELIEKYHDEYIPLIVPITLINHYVRKYGNEYLKNQVYLNPSPPELILKNHV